jgi:hypothetical protein
MPDDRETIQHAYIRRATVYVSVALLLFCASSHYHQFNCVYSSPNEEWHSTLGRYTIKGWCGCHSALLFRNLYSSFFPFFICYLFHFVLKEEEEEKNKTNKEIYICTFISGDANVYSGWREVREHFVVKCILYNRKVGHVPRPTISSSPSCISLCIERTIRNKWRLLRRLSSQRATFSRQEKEMSVKSINHKLYGCIPDRQFTGYIHTYMAYHLFFFFLAALYMWKWISSALIREGQS